MEQLRPCLPDCVWVVGARPCLPDCVWVVRLPGQGRDGRMSQARRNLKVYRCRRDSNGPVEPSDTPIGDSNGAFETTGRFERAVRTGLPPRFERSVREGGVRFRGPTLPFTRPKPISVIHRSYFSFHVAAVLRSSPRLHQPRLTQPLGRHATFQSNRMQGHVCTR